VDLRTWCQSISFPSRERWRLNSYVQIALAHSFCFKFLRPQRVILNTLSNSHVSFQSFLLFQQPLYSIQFHTFYTPVNKLLFWRCCKGWYISTSQIALIYWTSGSYRRVTWVEKIECFLLAPQSLAGVDVAHSQLHGPPAVKSDLVQGNIFSQRPCLRFRRPGHMLWDEVGRQTKRVVICPHCVAIDLLLLAAGFLEGTASSKEMPPCSIKRKVSQARPPMRPNYKQKRPSETK